MRRPRRQVVSPRRRRLRQCTSLHLFHVGSHPVLACQHRLLNKGSAMRERLLKAHSALPPQVTGVTNPSGRSQARLRPRPLRSRHRGKGNGNTYHRVHLRLRMMAPTAPPRRPGVAKSLERRHRTSYAVRGTAVHPQPCAFAIRPMYSGLKSALSNCNVKTINSKQRSGELSFEVPNTEHCVHT